MEQSLSSSFREQIASVYQQLSTLSDQNSQLPFRKGCWSRKEILGHLIDSALNNHQRFVRASLDGVYEGPSYEQQGWVAMHGYATMPWNELLQHWRLQNELLCAVVDRIPETRLEVSCKVGNNSPVTLRFLINDYLTHLHHHVGQIVPGATA
jgi:hypothetical protein